MTWISFQHIPTSPAVCFRYKALTAMLSKMLKPRPATLVWWGTWSQAQFHKKISNADSITLLIYVLKCFEPRPGFKPQGFIPRTGWKNLNLCVYFHRSAEPWATLPGRLWLCGITNTCCLERDRVWPSGTSPVSHQGPKVWLNRNIWNLLSQLSH